MKLSRVGIGILSALTSLYIGCGSPVGSKGDSKSYNEIISVTNSVNSAVVGSSIDTIVSLNIYDDGILIIDPDGSLGSLPPVDVSVSKGDTKKTISTTFNTAGTFNSEAKFEGGDSSKSGLDIIISEVSEGILGTIDLFSLSSNVIELGSSISFSSEISYEGSGSDILEFDPDGSGNLSPIQKSVTASSGTVNISDSYTYLSRGTYNPTLRVLSNPDDLVSLGFVDVVDYKTIEDLVLSGSGSTSGRISLSFRNPSDNDTSKVSVYSSKYDYNLSELIANGDANHEIDISVTSGNLYDAVVSGLDSSSLTFVYLVSQDKLSKTVKSAAVSSGVPKIPYSLSVSFSENLVGQEVELRDKYGIIRSGQQVSTDNDSFFILTDLPENFYLDIYVSGLLKGSCVYSSGTNESKNL